MRKISKMLFAAAILGGAGAYAWNRLLTPEARQSFLGMMASAREAAEKVRAQAEDMTGTYAEENLVGANKQKAEKQWAMLGL